MIRAEVRRSHSPNEIKEVQALVTPAPKAVAGDYVTTVLRRTRKSPHSRSALRRHDVHALGHRRYRADRRSTAGHDRRRGVVRSTISENVIRRETSPSATTGPPSSMASRLR